MGMSFALTGFPLMILFVLALVSPSNLASPNGSAFCNVGPNGGNCAAVSSQSNMAGSSFACTSGFNACFVSGIIPPFSIVTCSTSDIPSQNLGPYTGNAACLIVAGQCYQLTQSAVTNVVCSAWPTSNTYLLAGKQFTTGGANSNGAGTINGPGSGSSFVILNDWTIILVGLTVAAMIASVTVLAIGLDSEAVHIFFIVTGLLIPWTILTVASGYGSGNSFFDQLNGAFGSMGSVFYGILGFVYLIGGFKTVSRGGS